MAQERGSALDGKAEEGTDFREEGLRRGTKGSRHQKSLQSWEALMDWGGGKAGSVRENSSMKKKTHSLGGAQWRKKGKKDSGPSWVRLEIGEKGTPDNVGRDPSYVLYGRDRRGQKGG